jgi:predicted O-methyltransferase YrrM
MDDTVNLTPPSELDLIRRESAALGFSMASEDRTGVILRVLAASKPGGALLELGTGTGISTVWILDGMDADTTLVTVESEEKYVAIARRHLGKDPRVTFRVEDGGAFLNDLRDRQFDLIFADTWPGKFEHLEKALSLVRPGGLYIVDDLLPQANWPNGHAAKVAALISRLEHDPRLILSKLSWSSGLIVAARRS